jgi:hypothetical protein
MATRETLDVPKMRGMDTIGLLGAYLNPKSEIEKNQIEEFCVSRVHDLRDLLLHDDHKEAARRILEFHLANLSNNPQRKCQHAQVHFLKDAVNRSHEQLQAILRTKPEGGVYGRDWGVGRKVVPQHRSTKRNFRTVVEDVEDNGYHSSYGTISTWDVRYVESMGAAFSTGLLAAPPQLAFDLRVLRGPVVLGH